MKFKLAITFLCILITISFCVIFISCNNSYAIIENVEGAKITGFEIFMCVDSNVDAISLSDKVQCSKNSVWKLYYDKMGQIEIPTKIAASKNGFLQDGDNIFYIVINSQNGTCMNTYQLTIHRSYAVNLSYYDGNKILYTEKVLTGGEHTITYIPNLIGYNFIGWQTANGENVSSVTLWNSIALYANKVEISFDVLLDVNGGEEIENVNINLTYGESAKIIVPTREHYDFLGWFVGDLAVTDNEGKTLNNWDFAVPKTLTAHWKLKQFNITIIKSHADAGTITGDGEYYYNTNITLTVSTNDGYNFLGWYDDKDNFITANISYTFNVLNSTTFIAKWDYYTVTTISNIESAGTITEYSDTKISIGKEVSMSATIYPGYVWIGWYNGNDLLDKELTYKFIMNNENIIIKAVFALDESLVNFTYILTNSTCEITGVIDKNVVEITIPQCATSIADGALSGCSNLERITLTSLTSRLGKLFGKSEYVNSTATQQGSIKSDVFYIPQTLRRVTIMQGDIPNYAFYNCQFLEEINLPQNILSIGDCAFYNCSGVNRFFFPKSLRHIGGFAFSKCNNYASFEFEDTENWYATTDSSDEYDISMRGTLVDFSNARYHLLYNSGGGFARYYNKYYK